MRQTNPPKAGTAAGSWRALTIWLATCFFTVFFVNFTIVLSA